MRVLGWEADRLNPEQDEELLMTGVGVVRVICVFPVIFSLTCANLQYRYDQSWEVLSEFCALVLNAVEGLGGACALI